MDIQELIDREQIRALLSHYNISGDRAKLNILGAVFTEDAVLSTPFSRFETKAGITKGFSEQFANPQTAPKGLSFIRHNLTTSEIEFTSPTSAKGRTYFMVVTDMGLDHTGVYIDKFVKLNEQWKIKNRDVRLDYIAKDTLFLANQYEFLCSQKQQRNDTKNT